MILNSDLEKKLEQYMKQNEIKFRSEGIKNCILEATNKDQLNEFLLELDKKLNRILYRQNLNQKLLEQLFANMGFPVNEDVEKDISLDKFYQSQNQRFGKIG